VDLGSDFDEFVRDPSAGLLRTACLLTGDRGHAEDVVRDGAAAGRPQVAANPRRTMHRGVICPVHPARYAAARVVKIAAAPAGNRYV
jgi:hypothetical protein